MPPRSSLPSGSTLQFTGPATTAVKATGGTVLGILILATVASTVTFNDLVGARLVLPASFPIGYYPLGVTFRGKIEVVTAGATNLLVIFD